jgi:SAM-dependent methyltransferase
MSILFNLISDAITSRFKGYKSLNRITQRSNQKPAFAFNANDTNLNRVLNVGGNSKLIELPDFYQNWDHILLDIDPKGKPDIVCDARELTSLPPLQFDAIYCSHNLEHYYKHDVAKVLAGFLHVLKSDGFVHIRVPDIGELMRIVVQRNMDIDAFLYESPAGPITVHDVIYGYGVEVERSGNDFYAHKTGFTQRSLNSTLNKYGFPHVYSNCGNLEIQAFAFINKPNEFTSRLLNLPDS